MGQRRKAEIHKKELSKVAQGAGTIFLGKVLGNAIQYLYTITVARILGVKYFGSFMLGLTVINVAGLIGRLGLDNGVIKYVSLYNGVGDSGRVKGAIVQSLKYSFAASVVLGILLFFAPEFLLMKLFHKKELVGIIHPMAFALPFLSWTAITLAATQGFQIMKYTVYGQNLFWPLSNLMMVLLFFLIGYKLSGVVAAYIISVILSSGFSIYFLFKAYPEIKEIKTVPETRELLRFSLPLLLATFLTFLLLWTDTLMLGHFRTSGEVGMYNAAMRTAMLTSMILVSFNTIFAPMLSDLFHKGDMQKLKSLFKTVTRWIYTVSLPLFLLLTLLSKEILSIFGPKFVLASNALIILALSQLVNAGTGSVGVVITMSGRQNLMMYNTVGVCLLNILSNYFLIPSYGIVGAAFASAISMIAFNLLMLLEVYLLLHMYPYDRKFLKSTISGAVAFGGIFFLGQVCPFAGFQKLFVYPSLFLAIFVGLLYIWKFDEEDKFVFHLLKRKRV